MTDPADAPDPSHVIAIDILDAWRHEHTDLFHYLVACSAREFDTEAVIRQLAAIGVCLLEIIADDIGMTADAYAAMVRTNFTTTPKETATP